jgi:hypothetical protein
VALAFDFFVISHILVTNRPARDGKGIIITRLHPTAASYRHR